MTEQSRSLTPASLRRLVSAIGIALALITSVMLPAGYLYVGYSHVVQHLQFKAHLNAASVARYIYSHEHMWQFQYVRLLELIELNATPGEQIHYSVFDTTRKLVLEDGDTISAPVAKRSSDVVVAGKALASIEAESSLRPLLINTSLVAILGVLLGLGIYIGMRIFPLRVLDRVLGRLEGTLGRLESTNRHFNDALTNMAQGLVMFDGDRRLLVVNEPFSRLFAVPKGKFEIGMTAHDFVELIARERNLSRERTEGLHAQQKYMIEKGKRHNYTLDTIDGRRISIVHTPMSSGGWITTYLDATERHKAEAKIAHMAHHDSLTELPTRLRFREQLQEELSRSRGHSSFAVLCLDLDLFKSVNDTLGHPAGDALLRAVAVRLREIVRDTDMLARLGGDEFAIIQTRTAVQPDDATALASRLIDIISAPYDLDGHQVVIGLSVGIAIAPIDGTDADQLLKCADMALYRAKEEGRGTYRFFEQAMDARAQARRRLELDLRSAMQNDEFELYYQPIVQLQSGEIVAFEALMRWHHPERGMVPPAEFIPLAETTGLIVPLGEWALRKACLDAAGWSRPVRVAVNLSPVQFKHRTLVPAVINALAISGLAPERLELEITESVLLQDSEGTLATLHTLRDFGMHISMDDFGTGYSSLSYLRSFPFDKIKIDQSFVRELSTRDDCVAIVRAVTGLGNSLGIATTAEGVETNEQLDLLRLHGCGEVQGYLFSKPRPGGDVEAMLSQSSSVRAAA
jgi:diguanylate cyclase (GGDEF)-like protein